APSPRIPGSPSGRAAPSATRCLAHSALRHRAPIDTRPGPRVYRDHGNRQREAADETGELPRLGPIYWPLARRCDVEPVIGPGATPGGRDAAGDGPGRTGTLDVD